MISKTVKEAWLNNLKVNLVLVEHLNLEMLNAQNAGSGYTVAQHLAHIVEVTKYWASVFDSSVNSLENLYYDYNAETETFKAEKDLNKIKAILTQTLETVLKSTETTTDFSDSPHGNADTFLIHMIVHDAHHRGQILLCLKTSNHPLPDENRLWSPWRSN